MEHTKDALARAISDLGAVELGRCNPDSLAFYYAIPPTHNGQTFDSLRHPGVWCVTTEPSLILGKDQASWDAAITPMPPWWTPERRFIWRHTAPAGQITYYGGDVSIALKRESERITASIEDGSEVPA